jgi:hypothetical protein
MNEFDDDLGRRLGRLGTSPNDSAAALAAVRVRSRQLHRRRSAVRATLATGVLALGATAMVVTNDARRDGGGERVSIANGGSTTAGQVAISSATTSTTTTSTTTASTTTSTAPTSTTSAATTSAATTAPLTIQGPPASATSPPSAAPIVTTKPSATTQPKSPPSSSATTKPSPSSPPTPSTASTVTTQPADTTVATTSPRSTRPPKRSTTTRPSTSTGPGSTSEPAPTTAVAPPQTFSCAGGSITVRLQGKRMVVVSGPTPAEGFEVKESKFSGQKIEVKFVGGDDQEVTLKIRIRDGVIVQESGN